VISPYELITAEGSVGYRLNSHYYITKHLIPVVNRVGDEDAMMIQLTQLFHIDIEKWYQSMMKHPIHLKCPSSSQ